MLCYSKPQIQFAIVYVSCVSRAHDPRQHWCQSFLMKALSAKCSVVALTRAASAGPGEARDPSHAARQFGKSLFRPGFIELAAVCSRFAIHTAPAALPAIPFVVSLHLSLPAATDHSALQTGSAHVARVLRMIEVRSSLSLLVTIYKLVSFMMWPARVKSLLHSRLPASRAPLV